MSDHGMPNHSIEDPLVIDKILSHLESRGSLRVSDTSPKEHARCRQRLSTQLKEPGIVGWVLHNKEEVGSATSALRDTVARWRLFRCQMCNGASLRWSQPACQTVGGQVTGSCFTDEIPWS